MVVKSERQKAGRLIKQLIMEWQKSEGRALRAKSVGRRYSTQSMRTHKE